MFRVSVMLLFAGMFVGASGCSGEGAGGAKVKTVPFSGKVLLDGTPHGNVNVTFTPQGSDGGVRTAYAQVKEDGSFVATTYVTGDGIVPGKYDVKIGAAPTAGDAPSADPSQLMASVAGSSIEKFEVDVPAEGLTDVELKMTSVAKPEGGTSGQFGIGL